MIAQSSKQAICFNIFVAELICTVKRVSRICLKKVCGWKEARLKRHRKFLKKHLGFGKANASLKTFYDV
jgi:hypothetical protein